MKERNFGIKRFSPLVLIAFFSFGCSVKENMDEMHDKTVEVADTSKKISETSENIADTSDEILATSGEIKGFAMNTYYDLRHGDASKIRADHLKNMNEADSLSLKMGYAAQYYSAFEFQLWKAESEDTEEKRVHLVQSGLSEFFKTLGEYVNEDFDYDTPPERDDQSEDDNRLKNLYALAFALHWVDERQIDQAHKKGFKTLSLESIISNALKSYSKSNSMDNTNPYTGIVGENLELATHILEVRYTALLLKLLTTGTDFSTGNVAKNLAFGRKYEVKTAITSNSKKLELMSRLIKGTNRLIGLFEQIGLTCPATPKKVTIERFAEAGIINIENKKSIETKFESTVKNFSDKQAEELKALKSIQTEVLEGIEGLRNRFKKYPKDQGNSKNRCS